MKERHWTSLDRKDWGSGPWDDEGDKAQWPDPHTGLPSLAVRNPGMGNWCGYVGVPPEHPLYGVSHTELDFDVHGGLSYSGKCQPGGGEHHGICHVPDPGEPDDVWWFGFDCAHYNDLVPGLEANLLRIEAERLVDMPAGMRRGFPRHEFKRWYKTLSYVRLNCYSLARQLLAHGSVRPPQPDEPTSNDIQKGPQ